MRGMGGVGESDRHRQPQGRPGAGPKGLSAAALLSPAPPAPQAGRGAHRE